MKVAVFGAAGWAGRAVLKNFSGRHDVRAFEINPEAWDTYSRFDGGAWDGDTVYGDIAQENQLPSLIHPRHARQARAKHPSRQPQKPQVPLDTKPEAI